MTLIDRYEIGERQTSACGIPTLWLEALDLLNHLQKRQRNTPVVRHDGLFFHNPLLC